MKRYWNELQGFLHHKVYMLGMVLTALCSYGYFITHSTIGVDDTAVSAYYGETGLGPLTGRWTMYLLNKFVRVDRYAPWMTDLLGVIFLVLSVTVWCVLFKTVIDQYVQLSPTYYLPFGALFLSCPLIAEVYIYQLHNGIGMSYGLTAGALIAVLEAMRYEISRRERVRRVLIAIGLLSLALGCYETFISVFAMGGLMLVILLQVIRVRCEADQMVYRTHFGVFLLAGIVTLLGSLIVRTLMHVIVVGIFDLSFPEHSSMFYRSSLSTMIEALPEMTMNLKRLYLLYYANGVAYLPIAFLVLGLVLLGIMGIVEVIRSRNVIPLICAILLPLVPVAMCIAEGYPTHYRSAQYVPLVFAFAVLMMTLHLSRCRKEHHVLQVVAALVAAVCIYNQCEDMNQWFYVDVRKYENVCQVLTKVAQDLEDGFDTSKPICLRGGYHVPYAVSSEAYISFDSAQFRLIAALTDPIDPTLKEKYYGENGKGYIFAETPVYSTLQWGITAFDGTAGQLFDLWEHLGYQFSCLTDYDLIEEAEQYRGATDMPSYPSPGYIVDAGDYLIVNLENVE